MIGDQLAIPELVLFLGADLVAQLKVEFPSLLRVYSGVVCSGAPIMNPDELRSFWKAQQSSLPAWYAAARLFCLICPSSAAAERAFAAWRAFRSEYDAIASILDREEAWVPMVPFVARKERSALTVDFCRTHDEIDERINANLNVFGGPKFWSAAERERNLPTIEARRAQLHADLSADEARCVSRREKLGEDAAYLALEGACDEMDLSLAELLRAPVQTLGEARALAAWAIDPAGYLAVIGSDALGVLKALAQQIAKAT